jgi:hypothetical protein
MVVLLLQSLHLISTFAATACSLSFSSDVGRASKPHARLFDDRLVSVDTFPEIQILAGFGIVRTSRGAWPSEFSIPGQATELVQKNKDGSFVPGARGDPCDPQGFANREWFAWGFWVLLSAQTNTPDGLFYGSDAADGDNESRLYECLRLELRSRSRRATRSRRQARTDAARAETGVGPADDASEADDSPAEDIDSLHVREGRSAVHSKEPTSVALRCEGNRRYQELQASGEYDTMTKLLEGLRKNPIPVEKFVAEVGSAEDIQRLEQQNEDVFREGLGELQETTGESPSSTTPALGTPELTELDHPAYQRTDLDAAIQKLKIPTPDLLRVPGKTVTLTPPQVTGAAHILDHCHSGKHHMMCCDSTGTGKTIIIAEALYVVCAPLTVL